MNMPANMSARRAPVREINAVVIPWVIATVCLAACGGDELGPIPKPQPAQPALFGTVQGRVCDVETGEWVAGAMIIIDDPEVAGTYSDADGRYDLADVPPGYHLLSITTSRTHESVTIKVVANAMTEHGPRSCAAPPPELGRIRGRICAGTYWLAGAAIRATTGDGETVTATTDADGFFVLTDLPADDYRIDATKGSFSATFTATAEAGVTTDIPEPVCIPPTTQIAVVTGVYDRVELVLDTLGFPVRDIYESALPTRVDTEGNVDLIYGDPTSPNWWDWADEPSSNYWLAEFLSDADWMAQYDIIFINCGVNDVMIQNDGAVAALAAQNLASFVADGGSVYVSDWASEIMERAFPNRIAFIGDDTVFGDARWGLRSASLAATVPNADLAQAIGRRDVTINLNLDHWVVMAAMQPGDLEVLVAGDVQYFTDGPGSAAATQVHTPLLAHFDHGDGRVLFTSAHLEAQTTSDLRDILRYTVFEL